MEDNNHIIGSDLDPDLNYFTYLLKLLLSLSEPEVSAGLPQCISVLRSVLQFLQVQVSLPHLPGYRSLPCILSSPNSPPA